MGITIFIENLPFKDISINTKTKIELSLIQ